MNIIKFIFRNRSGEKKDTSPQPHLKNVEGSGENRTNTRGWTEEQRAAIDSLGGIRHTIILCLGGDARMGSRRRFDIDLKGDFIDQYEFYIKRVYGGSIDNFFKLYEKGDMNYCRWISASIYAGLLSCGDKNIAPIIVDNFLEKAFLDEKPMGPGTVMPYLSFLRTLPFPPELRSMVDWHEGSSTQTALRTWLTDNQDRLIWDRASGTYHF